MIRVTAAGGVVVVVALLSGVANGKPAKWTTKLDSGAEYDTNIHRLELPEGEQVDGAPLVRTTAEITSSWQRAKNERFRFVGIAMSKLFATGIGQSENIAVMDGDATYSWAVSKRGGLLSLNGSYYDAFGYDVVGDTMLVSRNFSIGNAEARWVAVGPKGHRLTLHGGVRRFVYKPDADFNWLGDHYGLRFETTLWRGDPDKELDAASVDVSVAYRAERRSYAEGKAFANSCPHDDNADFECFTPTDTGRADLNHQAAVDVAYNTGSRIWSARYELVVNSSNSFGQNLARQRLELGLTAEVGKRISLSASVALLYNVFLDPLLLGGRSLETRIDEENRNSLSLMIARKLTKKWSIEARYNFYTNEFATRELHFRRHTVYSGLSYSSN